MEKTDYIKLNEDTKLLKFTNSVDDVFGCEIKKKNIGENILNTSIISHNECLICYETIKRTESKVSCKLCSNTVHYKCYKKFVKKNIHFKMKCCHCLTQSLRFKYWWMCCW